jgi:Arc/MetJ-type ribon-helix-helix transcriptional regulator
MQKTTLYLPSETVRRMRQAAKRLGKSRAEMTREALDEYLDHSERVRGLPPSVGMGHNKDVRAADDEAWLAKHWGPRS